MCGMHQKDEKLQLWLTGLCGAFLVGAAVAHFAGGKVGSVEVYAALSALAGSYFAIKSAYLSLRDRSLDVNLLMVLAAIGAVAVGHVEDAAILLFLFSLGSTMEALAEVKAQNAIEALVKLRPDQAIRITASGDEKVKVDDLKIDDHVRVLPFEPIPLDGTLLSENASINEAAITGESKPVEKVIGEELLSGTTNLDAMITMKITHAAGDSTLEKIVALVSEAQENKASGERISKWFGEKYTIFVVVAFLVSLGARSILGQPMSDAFYSSLILLVALSPCALVISTPAATLSALANAARNGVLVRGGLYIEEAGQITTIALDKTGTLTKGTPQVVEVCIEKARVAVGKACAEDCSSCNCIVCWHQGEVVHDDASETLRMAASAESFSTHPIATSIVEHAKRLGIAIPEASNHTAFAGLGIEAVVESKNVRIGQPKFFENSDLPAGFRDHVEEMRGRGITAVLINVEDRWAAIGLRDEPRPTAKAFIQDLRDAGVKHILMLTGDNKQTAHAVAKEVGIDDVNAELLPGDKQKIIQDLVAKGEKVLMVGDGINDAPALVQANLGIAMGGLGSDVALRSADVVLIQDRIERIPYLIRLGRKSRNIIRANLLFAAGVILCLTIASFFTTLPLWVAVMGHEGSTVLVILNGLRLLNAK